MRVLARSGNKRLLRGNSLALAGLLALISIFAGLLFLLLPSAKQQLPIPEAVRELVSPPASHEDKHDVGKSDVSSDKTPSSRGPRYLHVLMHAPHQDPTLCKSVTSALALDYPTPRIFNLGNTIQANVDTLLKLESFAKYLDGLGADRDDDLVLIVDGYNHWFQLRPELLIHRFLEANAKASQRLQSQRSAQGLSGVRQEIIFAAQKFCGPWGRDDPACTAVPESSLPRNVYGPDTDKYKGSERFPHATFRPRYLDSGTYMGRLAAMKAVVNRAKDIMFAYRKPKDQLLDAWTPEDWTTRSDKVIFQTLFTEQEVARKHGKCSRGGASAEKCEFSIGLDYESRLTQAYAFSEGDMDWMQHDWLSDNHTAQASNVETNLGTGDLLNSQKPFEVLAGKDEAGWDNVPLYTNKFTKIAPAIVQHNIDADNLLDTREASWAKMWYHKHLRAMLDARPDGADPKKLAVTKVNGEEVEWWTAPQPEGSRRGAYSGENKFIPWDELCKPWQDDVFRDKS